MLEISGTVDTMRISLHQPSLFEGQEGPQALPAMVVPQMILVLPPVNRRKLKKQHRWRILGGIQLDYSQCSKETRILGSVLSGK